jgi:transposase
LPFGGGALWRGSFDGNPVAGTAPREREFRAQASGGDTRSRRIEDRRGEILTLWEARKDVTLEELRMELAGSGLVVAISTLHRFFARHGITRKKRPATRSSRTDPTS